MISYQAVKNSVKAFGYECPRNLADSVSFRFEN